MAIVTTPIYKTFNITLELKQTSTNPPFSVIEGDTGNKLHITVTDGGIPVDLGTGRIVAVFSKSNGTSMQDSLAEDGGGIEIGGTSNNEVTISLFKSSMAPGNVECELQIYSGVDGEEVLVTTARFNFECNRAMMNEDILMSTNEYPLLVQLINTVNGYVDTEAVRVLAENSRELAEALRNQEENIRNQNEAERIADEAKRDEAEAVRVSNENVRIENENLRKGAENQRDLAEDERLTAETARVKAETARDIAEKDRSTAEAGRDNAETLRINAENQRVLEFAKWLAANASVTTLEAGTDATVELTEVNGVKHFKFGIPRGRNGEGIGDMEKSIYDANGDGVVDKVALSRTITLTSGGWTGSAAPYTQTVAVNGVLADAAAQVILAAPDLDYIEVWGNAGMNCTGQGENSLTFSCNAVPESEITANIVILGVKS